MPLADLAFSDLYEALMANVFLAGRISGRTFLRTRIGR